MIIAILFLSAFSLYLIFRMDKSIRRYVLRHLKNNVKERLETEIWQITSIEDAENNPDLPFNTNAIGLGGTGQTYLHIKIFLLVIMENKKKDIKEVWVHSDYVLGMQVMFITKSAT